MNSLGTNKRFERADRNMERYSYKVREWINLAPTNDIGDFLSRLWKLFGPPDEIAYEGFTYIIKDSKTGIIFSAYCAGSGPAFGGSESALLDVSLDDFEKLLENTSPADCEIEFPNDFGIFRTGAHNGIPFGKTISEE